MRGLGGGARVGFGAVCWAAAALAGSTRAGGLFYYIWMASERVQQMSSSGNTPVRVEKALHLIRRAETGKQALELQKEANDRKIKEGLQQMFHKKKRKKSSETDQSPAEDYLIDKPAVRLRQLGELKRQAGVFFSFAKSQRNINSRRDDRGVGKPRVIFSKLVAEIKGMVLDSSIDAPIVSPFPLSAPTTRERERLRPLTARSPAEDVVFVPPPPSRPRPKSANYNAQQHIEKRDAILLQKEHELMAKISLKKNREEFRRDTLQRQSRQKAFLVLDLMLRHQAIFSQAWSRVLARRELIKKNWAANAKFRAAVTISRWWGKHWLMLRLRRSPGIFHRLLGLIVKFKHKLLLRKKCQAVVLIRSFVRDVAGLNDWHKQLRDWRRRVIKLQRYIRAYQRVQGARLRVMWKAVEREGRRRLAALKRAHMLKERKAMLSMSSLKGFGPAMNRLGNIRMQINRIHEEIDMKRRHWRTDDEAKAQERELLEEATNPVQKLKESKTRLWVKSMMASPATAEKLETLRAVLKTQRRRHLLALDETLARLKKGERKVNENALRSFLRKPDANDGIDELFDVVGVDGKRMETKKKTAPVFLLLTRGALSFVLQQPDSFFFDAHEGNPF